MDRFVLTIALWLGATLTSAQAPVELHQDLARSMQSNDWAGALRTINSMPRDSTTTPVRETLECMQAYLLEIALATQLQEPPLSDLQGIASMLTRLNTNLEGLTDAYPRCQQDAPAGVDVRAAESRVTTLAYLLPAVERAASVAGEASAHQEGVGDDLAQVFHDEYVQLSAQIPSGPADAWERTQALYRGLSLPPSQPRESPMKSQIPAIGTGAVMFGFGFVSFLASFTVFSGRGLPSLVAGGWGLTFGLLPAFASAWTWDVPSRALLIFSTVATAIAGVGGALALTRLETNGRYFGRGLLIGSGLSVAWLIGGWAHRAFHRRSRRAWVRSLSFAPQVGPDGAGFSASGRF